MRLITRALAALLLVVALSACTPQQVTAFFAARGHSIPAEDAQRIADRINLEAYLNATADHAARNTGRRGTCSPTGIFYAESGGNWYVTNPRSSASGGFQYLDSTWAGHRGYRRAVHAPAWVQWERFQQTWAGGAGRAHWAASVC